MSCDEMECQAEPAVVDASDVGLETTDETMILESVGHASACDVWFSVPEEWGDNVLLRLYAMLGGFKVLLHKVKLGDASALVEAGRLSGISISVRGRPCTSFQLTAQRVSGGSLEDGKFLLRVWADNDSPSVLGGAPIGEFGLSPTRAEPIVSLGAGYNTDSGDLADRFKLLRVDTSGALHVVADAPIDVAVGETLPVEGTGSSGTPAGGVLTVQGPAAGVLSVSAVGTGTAGSPAGGVLTVQGPNAGTMSVAGGGSSGSPSGGVLSVQGPGSGGLLGVVGGGTSGAPSGGVLSVQGPGSGGLLGVIGAGTSGTPSGGVLSVQGPASGGVLTVTGDQAGGAHKVVGAGTAGVPSGGILTVQGASGASALPVDQGLGIFDATKPWVVQLSNGSAYISDNAPLPSKIRRPVKAFSVATGVITGPTTAGTATSIGYVWRSTTLNVEIVRFVVSWFGGAASAGNGEMSIRGTRITALNGTPGGTTPSPLAHDTNDGVTASFRAGATGAPTRASSDMFILATRLNEPGRFEWQAESFGKPILLRANVSEGFEIRAVADLAFTTGMKLALTIHWHEI
jgi:hypothetical protein